MSGASPTIDADAFFAVDMRAGTVVTAEPNRRARKPAYVLSIDFGPELGVKRSSAQVTELYGAEALVGARVVAVVNLPPRRIAGVESEVLVLGAADAEGRVVLLAPGRPVPDGARVH